LEFGFKGPLFSVTGKDIGTGGVDPDIDVSKASESGICEMVDTF
jgi:hypothetical protein